ncbi:MAG: phytanoyl-CoA dioxygenase family protein [Bacteroidota bacterium]
MLNTDQVNQFNRDGYLLLERYLSEHSVQLLVDELPILFTQDSAEVYKQENSEAIRTVFAPEKFSPIYEQATRLASIVEPIKQLLQEEVYLFQSKFNTKVALARGSWDWHQDFTFWQDDGMPAARAITAAIYLQEVTEFSGAMVVIPGSHQLGTVATRLENPDGVHSEDLKYVISRAEIQHAAEQCGGMRSTKGPQGSVLFFHSNLLHASAQNLHHQNRDLLMLTYNPVSNACRMVATPRPSYMVKRDSSATIPTKKISKTV